MAQQEELVIVIKTETIDLVRGLATAKNGLEEFGKGGAFSINELNKALKALSREAEKTSDPLRRAELGQKYQELSAKIGELRRQWQSYNGTVRETGTIQVQANTQINNSSKSIDGISESTRRARIAVFGLNQVVRDLPFGFIAISNNLPVLIDQFVELRKESNGTLPALRNFGRSLIGIGGFSIAISAGISLITTAVQKYGSLGAAFDELTGSISATEAVQRDFNKALADGQKDLAVSINNLDLIASVANNAAVGLENQAYAGQLLREEIDKIVLSQEGQADSTAAVGSELLDYAKRVLIVRANLQAFNVVIGELAVEFAKATLEGVTFTDYLVAAVKKVFAFTDAIKQGNFALAEDIAKTDFVVIAKQRYLNRLEELKKRQKEAQDASAAYLNAEIKGGVAAIDALGVRLKKTKELEREKLKAAKDAESALRKANAEEAKRNKELQKAATLEEKRRIEFEIFRDALDRPIQIQPVSGLELFKAGIDEARRKLQELNKETRPNQQNIFDISAPVINTDAIKNAQSQVQKFIKQNDEFKDSLTGALQSQINQVSQLFNQTLGPAIDDIFRALASGENVLQNLSKAFQRLVLDIAATIIKSLILKAILTAINPAAGLASGGAASIASGVTKAIQSLAGTASPIAGGPPIVGPGGVAISGQVVFVQRGTDLVGVLDRSNARIGRVG